jgi:DNA repair exonuclease SbcCD ATPase subunit
MTDTTAETTPPPEGEPRTPEKPEDDQRVPYERFQKANKDAKEAKDRASKLEKQMADLQAQIQEREQAGMPELERERKQREAIEKRLAEAESRAEQAERDREQSRRERWVTDAASELNFKNPRVAAKLIDGLADIEDPDQAMRAVKRLAKSDDYLIKQDEPALPGRVLSDGRPSSAPTARDGSNIDLSAEAALLAEGLKQFASKD